MRMSSLLLAALLAGASGLVACHGAQVERNAGQPAPEPVKVSDPMAGLKARFETAYFQIGCQANHGRDPINSIVPMQMPAQYLEAIQGTESGKRDKAERTVRENGFVSIPEFLNIIIRMKSDGEYWQTIQDRYIDELIKCAQ
ncbi:MAG TPA: hypothetical protein PLY68_04880 [Myxococcota bacterium]|nr:hypothetical protein [Myxococcota bacterium]HNZ03979.1 hypothetical protein [Myxococcota bacterium]HOD07690.1 hypothetical protein [Myxococcota bacterium]HPB51291.1 hypothetical protein [Myxococcota bacterium]HQP95514.1 hypothetical protein [Myxococcota bacterium]